jgi:hypothetical protein
MPVWPTICTDGDAVEECATLRIHWTGCGPGRIKMTARNDRTGGIMIRVLGVVRTIGSLLAIELVVPGGTLIVLAILLTGRSGSPLLKRIGSLLPVPPRLFQRLASIFPSAVK